ncbi:hypothetical protein TURU_032682 [Turdus rufiventris]|nr:hypothetical protein TURU_032682 [Turdus rufiventris]
MRILCDHISPGEDPGRFSVDERTISLLKTVWVLQFIFGFFRVIKEKLEKEVALVDKVERNLSLDLIVEISSSLNDSVIPARCRMILPPALGSSAQDLDLLEKSPEEAMELVQGLEPICSGARLGELGMLTWRREGSRESSEPLTGPKGGL